MLAQRGLGLRSGREVLLSWRQTVRTSVHTCAHSNGLSCWCLQTTPVLPRPAPRKQGVGLMNAGFPVSVCSGFSGLMRAGQAMRDHVHARPFSGRRTGCSFGDAFATKPISAVLSQASDRTTAEAGVLCVCGRQKQLSLLQPTAALPLCFARAPSKGSSLCWMRNLS